MTGTTALDRLLDKLRERGGPVRASGGSWSARCPAHDDHDPSLNMRGIPGQALLYCHAGCATTDVVAALGLTVADLFDEPRGTRYDYADAVGTIVRSVHRTPEKRFRQSGNTKGTATLYRLPEVIAAVAAGTTVYLVEGEKDADALASVGASSTTSPMGASNWAKVDPSPLRGARVIVVPDQDDAGQRYARDVLASLDGLADEVRVARPAVGKDAADHVAAGLGLDDLVLVDVEDVRATRPAPTPLSKAPTPPPFPTGSLGGWAADMVQAVAVATQTDSGVAGTLVLGALAAAAGGHAEVTVRSGWREPVNLYVVAATAPGTRKSAVFREVMDPLRSAERALVETTKAAVQEATITRDVARHAAEAATRKAGGAEGEQRKQMLADAVTAGAMAEEITVPAMPRLLADDVTPEAMTSLLAEHGGNLAVISAEGGIFDVLAGRYSRAPNIDAALKGHAGDTLRVDRKGRPPEYVERPALTMALTVQPAVLEAIGSVGEFSGRGLLARFLYALPPSLVGHRQVGAPPVPDLVRERYAQRLQALAEGLAAWTEPMVLVLDADAAALHLAAERQLEPRLAPTGDLGGVVEWASKLLGAVARIAGLLHLAEHGDAGARHPVSGATMRAALALGDYYTAHALAVFDLMGADRSLDDARTVLAHLHARSTTQTTVRDLHASLPRSRFPKATVVLDALTVLEDYSWAERLPSPEHTGPGRPPSPSYRIHPPSVATEHTQYTEPPMAKGSVDSVCSVATSTDWCAVCGEVMVVLADGQTTHPGCEAAA